MSNFQFNRDANGNPFWHAPLPNKAWDAGNKSVSMWDRCQLCGEAWPCAFIKELTRAVPVTGIWLRAKSGGVLEVLAEIDGEWRVVIRQAYLDGNVLSNIVEPLGMRHAEPDRPEEPPHA